MDFLRGYFFATLYIFINNQFFYFMRKVFSFCAKSYKLLYANNTNIDYFPTNFVVQNETLYYIDYECNDYMEEWNFENWGIKYWSKTPEFIEYVNTH